MFGDGGSIFERSLHCDPEYPTSSPNVVLLSEI